MSSKASLARVLLTCLAAACTPVAPDPGMTRYEEHGPKFTAEQKAAMSDEQKVDIYNYHVPRDEELVCRNESPVGSHFKKMNCRSRSQIREERREQEDRIADFINDGR